MKAQKLDHLVLTVADIDRTVAFYTTTLGMQKQVFADGRIALKFGEQKINLHKYQQEHDPKAHHPTPGSADLCFITDTELESAMAQIKHLGIEIIAGPVERTGANGPLKSFYFRDPDMNLIEVATEVKNQK